MKIQFVSILALSIFALSGCGGGGGASQQPGAKAGDSSTPATQAVDPATVGTITGVVKFTGTKPKPRNLNMAADAYCKTQHAVKVPSEEVVVNSNGSLKNVYVYVKSGFSGTAPVPSEPVILDQKGCLYSPHVIAVQVGQQIIIRNSDGVLHNVNARPTNNKPFNIGQPVKGMENKKYFAKAEIAIPVKCDVHPWMSGYIAVADHSFHMVTGDDGKFTLNNLPPGNYEIGIWHESLGTTTQNVSVTAQETKNISFSMSGSKS